MPSRPNLSIVVDKKKQQVRLTVNGAIAVLIVVVIAALAYLAVHRWM